MKTRNLILLVAGLLTAATAFGDNLPSDAEMQALGKKQLGDFGAAIQKAQQSLRVQPTARVDVPQDTQVRSPIEKALIDETMSDANSVGKNVPSKKGNDLIVFVSFSMPDDELKSYSEQAREAGAVLVMRGLVNNSLQQTKIRAYQVSHARAGWEINPSLFKKFKVDRVPVIILADGANKVTDDGCAVPTSYLRVDGSVAIRQALLLMRRYGDQPKLVKDAADRLYKLEHSK